MTLHRPALVDSDELLSATVEALIALTEAMQVVFPVHPRTRERLRALDLLGALEEGGVTVTAPLGYREFLGLEARARLVVTDSAGAGGDVRARRALLHPARHDGAAGHGRARDERRARR